MHIKSLNTLSYVVFVSLSFVVPIGIFVVISIFRQQNGLRDAPIDVAIGRLVAAIQFLSSHVMFSHNLCPNLSLQGCCQPVLSDEGSIFCSSQTGWEQKEYEKTTKWPSKEHGREGGRRENGGRSSWGLGWPEAPFFAVFLGGRAAGPARGSGRYRRPTRVAIWRQCDGMKGRGGLAQGRGTAPPRPLSIPVANKVSKQKSGGKEVKEKVVGSEAQGRRARGKTWRQWPVDSRAPAEGGGGEEPA